MSKDGDDTAEQQPHVVIGFDVTGLLDAANISEASSNVYQALQVARQDTFDFVTTTIPDTDGSAARDDVTLLDAKWWATSVVGVIPDIEKVSPCLEWSQHMDLPAVILPALPTSTQQICDYAASLAGCLSSGRSQQQLWIPVRVHEKNILDNWFVFHQLIDYHPSISILLVLEPCPTTPVDVAKAFLADTLYRFHILIGSAAPISAVALSTSLFLTNKKGFPTLPKAQQTLVSHIFRRAGSKLRLLLAPTTTTAAAAAANPALTPDVQGPTGTKPHLQYLRHFRRTRPEVRAALDTAAAEQELDFYDALQSPLQPLADHLPFATYEVFELDPVKYKQYERAVMRAMQDFLAAGSTTNSFTVVVAGAGRGPLVTACLQAHRALGSPLQFHVFAVEKNPSAVLYLQSKLRTSTEWSNATVTIVKSDLRELSAARLFGPNSTQTVNLVVSELLGSFGCNELSPECLDTLFTSTNVCGPHTISIPTRYTSFAAPVASIKLYQKVIEHALFPDPARGMLYNNGLTKAFETPYVVRPHAASQMGTAQPCWVFAHPPTMTDGHACQIHLSFPPPSASTATALGPGYGAVLQDLPTPSDATILQTTAANTVPWTCTGILGTFTADLYDHAEEDNYAISTNPDTFSTGMFSWFPLYFPLARPLVVPAGATVQAHIRRRTATDRVWYEWSVQVLQETIVIASSPIQNPGGRSYHVSLTS